MYQTRLYTENLEQMYRRAPEALGFRVYPSSATQRQAGQVDAIAQEIIYGSQL
jgi:hypothetical protein